MYQRLLLILLLAFGFTNAYSTHNRAGEITYTHVSGLTYEFTITTCTKTSSPADREWLTIDWGDNSGADSVQRDNIVFLPSDAQVNTYIRQHTFAGPSVFTIGVEDPNRNSDIENIPNSVNQSFCIETVLVISPFVEPNNSVQLLNDAKDNACVGKKWLHNPGATDVDGDSLVYSLVPCRGENCSTIPGWELPNEVNPNGSGALGTFTINSETGDVCWDAPAFTGEYNIAILISEYRQGIFVGSVIRDMQITVVQCNNDPPQLIPIVDTCIEAGSTLNFDVSADDPNPQNTVEINYTGDPILEANAPTFTGSAGTPIVTYNFNWDTDCSNIDGAPYQVYFQAEDSGSGVDVSLTDYTQMNITVVAPAPLNPSATPSGNSILLNWDPSVCDNATGYKIYRRLGLAPFTPSNCELGVPAYTGYQFIGSTNGWTNTTYTDNIALVHGEEYCYMVVACFANDGDAESYASVEFCTRLNKDVPIITRVDVNVTDPGTGQDTVEWFNPTELDTITQWPGPYYYIVYQDAGFNSANTVVFQTPQSNDLYLTQNFFSHTNINTEDNANTYRIELYANNILVGATNTASSIWLTIIPNDNENELNWTYNVPWGNDSFHVFRFNPGTLLWDNIGTSFSNTYTDTGLINGVEYCYYVRGFGGYSDPDLPIPLINDSQEECSTPIDRTPPCPPTLEVEGECSVEQNTVWWNNVNNSCADDAIQYNLYFTPTDSGDYTLLETFFSEFDTTFLHEQSNGSIAGCYAVTAVDTFGNESEYSNIVCIDNCPEYVLPNVFSPNADGFNDVFHPFPYRHVESIDITIYNRWGNVVHTNTDPDINWDGTNQDSQEPLADGVYYYICTVNTIRLSGIEPVVLKGYVQLFNEAKPDFK